MTFHNSKTRFGALILAVALTFAQLPITVFTADADTTYTTAEGGLITAFDPLSSPYEAVNSGNYNVTVPSGIPAEKLPLPKELSARVLLQQGEIPVDQQGSDGNTEAATTVQAKIAVTWTGSDYDAQAEGQYLFNPILPNTYTLDEDVLLPGIYVEVSDTDCVCKRKCIPGSPNIECPHCAATPEKCVYNPDSCICLSKCTEDAVNSYCPYCADNWQECSYEQGLLFGEYPSFGRRFGLMRSSGPVVTDNATYDVYMNVNPMLGMDINELKNLVSSKLATLISGNPETVDQTYRILTSETTIDTTDLRYWYVYDHYDTAAWPGSTATESGSDWKEVYKEYKMYGDSGRQRPYQAVTETEHYNGIGGTTTIKHLLENNQSLNKANRLAEHIYAGSDASGAFMIFDGYGDSATGGNDFTDFLFYPAKSKGIKTVSFTVDASEVEPHSLESAGFLCNVGVSEDSANNGTISGYVVAFGYKTGSQTNPSGGVKANNYNYIRLYRIKDDVSALDFSKHIGSNSNLKIATYATPVGPDVPLPSFFAKTDVRLSIQETSIKLEMRAHSADPNAAYTEIANWTTTSTGYQGFGPYVAYEDSGHSCENVSAFRFSNLKMSFAENISSDSLLSALASADYLDKGKNRYFVNLIGSKNYALEGSEDLNDQDKAYISQMQSESIMLITDKTSAAAPAAKIYPEHYLGDNSQDVNTDVDWANPDFTAILDSAKTSDIDTKAAEIAWLIYKGTWDSNSGAAVNPTETALGKLILMDGAPGAIDKPWEGANQINTIQKELIGADGLKVYLNPDESKNADGLTADYTLIKPDGTVLKLVSGTPKAGELELKLDDTQNNKPYFVVPKDWAQGDYTVTLKHQPAGTITKAIPGTTKLSISTDTTAPAVTKPVITLEEDGRATATLGCTNTESKGSNTYTSALGQYAVVVTSSATPPSAPTDKTEITSENPLPASYTEPSVVSRTVGTYYTHVYVWDQAGNMGVNTESFTVTGPDLTMTKPSDIKKHQTEQTAFDARDPDTGKATVTFDLSGGTYEPASYTVKTSKGDDVTVTEIPTDGKVNYELPAGKYELTLIVTDTAGNQKELSLWVDAKKTQSFSDEAHKVGNDFIYVLEAGKDTNLALAMRNSSDFAQGDVQPSPLVEYTLPTTDPKVIGLVNGVMAPIKLGTVTITAKAAETASHYGAEQAITIRVIPPLAVNLVASGYDSANSSGIAFKPSHTLGAYALNTTTSPASLRYREAGDREWINIPSWGWDTDAPLRFADLKPNTKYEVEVSATDTRPGTPTTATKVISFRTPASGANTGAGPGNGNVEVGITDVKANKVVNVSIQVGSTVLAGTTLTGPATDGDVSHTFTELPDGVYNVVFEHEGKVVTDVVEIKNGQASKAVIIPFAALADRETRVVHANDIAPSTVVGGLNNQYAPETLANQQNKGITQADLDAIETEVDGAKGSALIELKVKGVLETDTNNEAEVKDAIHKIKEKSAGQSFALFADLSLWKTITPARALSGTTTQLIEANALIDIIIPLPTIRGSNIRVYRVHDADGADRSDAAALAEEIPMGQANANAFGEYCEMTKESMILHVRLFSLYAIGYDLPDEDNSSTDDFWLAVKDQVDAGKNDDVIYIDAKNYEYLPASIMDKLVKNPNLSLVIKINDKKTITIPVGKAVVPELSRVYYPFSLLEELYKDVTFINPQTGGGSYFTTKQGKVIPATGVLVQVDEHATSSILPNKALTQDEIRALEFSRLYPALFVIAAAVVTGFGLALWRKKRKPDQSF